MTTVTIHLHKPAKGQVISYEGELVQRTAERMLIRARWERGLVDLGQFVFEPGDELYEYFYCDRWYSVYELHAPDGRLKGWYCNFSRPAVFDTASITTEDLELDMLVSPDRQTLLVLDEDEYAALGLRDSDPAAHRAVQAALEDVRARAGRGEEPFQTHL